jgi:hypothetical protein
VTVSRHHSPVPCRTYNARTVARGIVRARGGRFPRAAELRVSREGAGWVAVWRVRFAWVRGKVESW